MQKSFIYSVLLAIVYLAGGTVPSYAADVGTILSASQATTLLTQSEYRWYENIDTLDPSTPRASQNTAATMPAAGSVIRLRVNILDTSAQLDAGSVLKLQFANATSGPWTDVDAAAAWGFYDNPAVADGQIILTTVLSSSDVGESYGESNPSAATPNAVLPSQYGEWDWVLRNNSASTASYWYFRMASATGTAFSAYTRYPTLDPAPPSAPTGHRCAGGFYYNGIECVPIDPPAPPSTPTPSPTASPSPSVTPTSTPATSTIPTQTPTASPTPWLTPAVTIEPKPGSKPGEGGPGGGSGLPIPPPRISPALQKLDANGDYNINIVDLSIFLYHYERTDERSLRFDFNQNGKVDFADVSIMMFYWKE